MKEYYISFLATDNEIQDFFMVKSIAVKLGSNKKQYLDLLLGDCTGEITAKKWDVADAELPSLNEIQPGDVVKVKAQVTEWNSMKQLRVMRIRKAVDQDDIAIEDYIKSAPEKPEDMLSYLEEAVSSMNDEQLKTLCTCILTDNREKLMYYPAAVRNHHAERAGLLYHMKRMLMMGEYYCLVYTNLNRDLVITGVIIHDIEKLNELESDTKGVASSYTFEGQLLGHLVQGIKTIDRLAKEIGIDKEKTIMLEHMILSHHYEPEFGSPKKPLFPEAEILHYLDIVDARMYDMEEALLSADPGGFSDKVWTLDNRRVYKPKVKSQRGEKK